MPIEVVITNDFEHLSKVAAEIVKKKLVELLKRKKEVVLGLATGNSPTGMYKHLARAANNGEFDSSRIRSFNLDEYIGLPGENAQQRALHPESYCYFMIQEFFGLLKKKFIETNVPFGSLIDQKVLIKELKRYPHDWACKGTGAGKSIVIKQKTGSEYLSWIRKEILNGYMQKIKKAGGIDIQIIGVGGRGHVAFHESGVPFEGSSVMLVKLDDNTIKDSVTDGHFISKKDYPNYAISMSAELVYQARNVVLLANGERKVESVTRSLLGDVNPEVPISYGQKYALNGGNLIYVLDKIAGRNLIDNKSNLKKMNIVLKDLT
ncbi:MAG TPA: glucosamine-6-phosphate deaminase [Syntrophorhabdus sp.]|jgi:glucosamine-6-phosphate deaminase|nr:glucosamine-6-phosphate deaminase [Syntrophorhabdus sp.]MDI9558060.1 glucosamine-6-phosphate deaminase [Pseudomonadota bacterium]OPX93025.1 MAG: Glucosamine-6-phosphate deaminase [Syntrophorhabdus sp. PtaB.Bin027]OQB77534.1 MAG: Glucosamine-6-phosphate deaminase [Deltaproteobacteria bacterium ADurb.Bin135]HNS78328.1 glucosamine-6-phosphate deaminase [Syntrophorhabdus sp.]